MIIGKYQLVLKTFFSESATFFEKCSTFCQPHSHHAIKITNFFMQIFKVDQVSFKLYTKCLSDVGSISRNQVLFFDKTELIFDG